MALVARCPECGAKLGIKDSASLGKKARCGKCQHVFVLQASTDPPAKKKSPAKDEFDDFGVDDGELADDFDDEFASAAVGRSPSRAGQGGKRGAKKKKKSGAPAWLKPASIGLGAMLVLGILIGVGFLIAGRNGGAEGEPLFAYLPPDAEVVATFRGREFFDSPFYAELRKNPLVEMARGMAAGPGLMEDGGTIEDVDSIALGLSGLSSAIRDDGASADKMRFIVVVRTRKPVDEKTLESKGSVERLTHNGQSYLKGPGPSPSQPVAVWRVDSTTTVIGTEDEVKRAIDNGPSSEALTQKFDFVDTAAHLAFGFAPQDRSVFSKLGELEAELPPEAPRQARELIVALKDSGNRAGFGMTFGTDTQQSFQIGFDQETAATSAEEAIKGLIVMGEGLVGAMTGPDVPEEDRKAAESAKQYLAGLKITRDQGTVTLAGTVSSGETSTYIEALGTAAMVGREAGRAAARASVGGNNLRNLALAMHNHHDVYKGLPKATILSEAGEPLLSWRAGQMLRFIEEDALLQQFNSDEPWDGPHNSQFIERMPVLYQDPTFADAVPPGETNYMVFNGPGAIFDDTVMRGGNRRPFVGTDFSDAKDGTTNTILIVQAGPDKAVPWSKPQDLPFDENTTVEALGMVPPRGFQVVAADGAVHILPADVSPDVLRALITRAGREAVSFPGALSFPDDAGSPPPQFDPPFGTVEPAPAAPGTVDGGPRPAPGIRLDRAEHFSYLPPNAELVAIVRPREVWNSKPLVELRNEPLFMMLQGMAAQSEQVDADQLPIDSVDDVDSVVIGLSGLSGAVGDPEQAKDAVRGLAVVRTSRAIDPARLANEDSEPATHSGTDYMRSTNRPDEDASRPPTAVWQVSPTLLVIGDEAAVRAAIDRGAGAPADLARKFEVLDTNAHFAFAYVAESPGFKDLAEVQSDLGDEAPPPLADLVGALVESGQSTAFALNFDDAIRPSFRFGFADEDAAGRAEQGLTGLVSLAAEMARFAADPDGGDPAMQQVMAIAQQFLTDLAVTRDETRVTLAGSLPNESFTILRQQAVAAVMNGMGGLEGDPGGPGIGLGGLGLTPAAPRGIQGEWSITTYEQLGEASEQMVGAKVTIGDGKFTVESAGQPASALDCTIDEDKKHLDLHYSNPRTNKPAVDSCIYELQGDTLRICLGRAGRRPDEFKTTRRDNPIRVLMTLSRESTQPGDVPGIGIAGQPPAPDPGFPQPPEGDPLRPAPPAPMGENIEVSTDDLAREFIDDRPGLPDRYADKAIHISGTIRAFSNDSILMVSTVKTPDDKVVEYEIVCIPGTVGRLNVGQNVVLLTSFGELTKYGMKLTNGRIAPP
ncbi:MAG: DUF1559 domain-containing protein [Planctomycetaceae bacterium]